MPPCLHEGLGVAEQNYGLFVEHLRADFPELSQGRGPLFISEINYTLASLSLFECLSKGPGDALK